MIRNYVLVALRNLTRNKFFSAINIFGLAISMSICLGIIMLVADQLSYDRHNTNRDRIYRVITRTMNPDGSQRGNDCATSPLPLANALVNDFTGVEKAVRIRRGFGNGWNDFEQDVNVPLSGFFADQGTLELLQHELEHGNIKTALVEPYSVVLTKDAAKKLFKEKNPVGELIKVGKLGEYKVTGVIKETGHKSHIVFEALASYATIKSLHADSLMSESGWGDYTDGWVYMQLEKGHTSREIEKHLASIAKVQKPTLRSANDRRAYQFYLQNISSITPGPFINNPIGPFMPMLFVYFIGGLALIIMLTSCFNYTNLSIARALNRAREIGVRKVNGAHRYQIFFQFLSEAVLLSLFALGIAIILLTVVKPFLINLSFAHVLKWDTLGNMYVYAAFFVFSVVVGVMAGFFPAVVLSKFQPVKVLKNAGGGLKLFSRIGLRKSLLVFQFTLSLIFIISVLVLYNQLRVFTGTSHGFGMDDKIIVKVKKVPYERLQVELLKQSNIENVAAASHVPAAGITYGDGFKKQISDAEGVNVDYFYVDANYVSNMDLQLIAGRTFEESAGESNKNFMVINESAVNAFHFKSPSDALGESVYCESDSAEFKIIGVVKDYNHQVLMEKIGPMALRYNAEEFTLLQVKYAGTYEAAAKTIEAVWAKTNEGYKIEYKSFEEEIKLFYKTVFNDFVKIIGVLAALAIIISCLGLLGMAIYTTETRMKEVSIRKVLGSSDGALVFLLSKGFLKLILISIVIAVPAAWFINNMWLEMIAYRTQVDATVILTGISVLIVLGGLTIGSQTLRAAYANPVDNLKNE